MKKNNLNIFWALIGIFIIVGVLSILTMIFGVIEVIAGVSVITILMAYIDAYREHQKEKELYYQDQLKRVHFK